MFVQIYTEKNTNITGYSSALPVIMGGKVKKILFSFWFITTCDLDIYIAVPDF